MGVEVVATSFDPDAVPDNNLQKWRNPNYPNLPADEPIPTPAMSWDNDISIDLLTNLKSIIMISSDNILSGKGIQWSDTIPTSPSSVGTEGNMSYDKDYLYVFTNNIWKRIPLSLF
jgi:hypothetical protein